MDDPEFTLKLKLSQINEMVACMGNGPFNQVSQLIAEFQKQMQAQKERSEPAP